ncbi:hypothetical protein PVK06_025199 [Gossypium arboreum]|uniref:HAT C-terminal dimerisation domain-containing protein n=1 Tax=Gossypium arboreum TaxID=29729 RepID=A0ABR0PG09_GOSAR|nr:hypothetical protein PVK06_025199 [Gossypium arboreum]
MKECIQSWNIDLKLSAITVDNCTTNDAMMDILHGEFPYGSLLLHDQFFLVDEYGFKNSRIQATSSRAPSDIGNIRYAYMQEFSQFMEQDKSQSYEKSNLEKYLEASNLQLCDDFDILTWWKTNGSTYLILQQIARDVLSISISIVPLEPAFNTNGRVLDPYRS